MRLCSYSIPARPPLRLPQRALHRNLNTLTKLKLWQIGSISSSTRSSSLHDRLLVDHRPRRESVHAVSADGAISPVGVWAELLHARPQCDGEPLQIIYLQRNHGISFARATSAVIMIKLLEFLANFALIGVGAWAILRCRDGTGSGIRLTLSPIGLGCC
ncbi:MAG: hypothetical protein U0X93_16190 [Anaerolineales bacterium]